MQRLLSNRVLVVGLGASGFSVARFLHHHGADFAIADSRQAPPNLDQLNEQMPDVEVRLGEFDGDWFCGFGCIVLSPGIALATPAVRLAMEAGIEVIGDIEIFARVVQAPVIAVTGSNGKSTVVTLLGEMAREANVRAAIGGNLGMPALDLLSNDIDLYILELSSFQLETTHSLKLRAAAVLNVSEDHMDRYDSLADYAETKRKIYSHSDVCVFYRDQSDTFVAQEERESKQLVSFASDTAPSDKDYGLAKGDNGRWLMRGERPLLNVEKMRLQGLHNQLNAQAALALGEAAGLPESAMLYALESFAGLAHRSQWVAEKDGVIWCNDSKGTNVGATIAAIKSQERRIVLIAGGEGKGADFSPLEDAMVDYGRAAVLIGQDANKIADVLRNVVPVYVETSMKDAVERAGSLARAGDSVLLSPACASFDMYKGFDARGDDFTRQVKDYLA